MILLKASILISHFNKMHQFRTPKDSKGMFPNPRSLVTVTQISLEEIGRLYFEQVDNCLLEDSEN
jgi:hypothetical protein